MSGIYIKGMEMPKKPIIIQIYPDGRVRQIDGNGYRSHADAIPVPDHGDLIDRDRLEKDIDKYIGGEESRSRFHHWVQVQSAVIPGNKGEQT